MEFIIVIATVILLAAIIGVTWWIRRAITQPRDDQSLVLLQNQVNALGAQVTQALDTSRQSMDERLDHATRVIQGVSQQLGQLDASSRRMIEIGKDISSLQDILRAPKLRGSLSELFLGDLLSQILPADHYRMQYSFHSGEIVDAVIVLKAGMVPVDAKFPLENFKRIVQTGNDDERRAGKKTFIKDVKNHIDAIAAKYIHADEGTFDFALMYIPAENVYYETILKDEEFSGEMPLFDYALRKRVIPVSPNSFYAYLQTILLGLKGLRVEESARGMLNQLSSLGREFERFEDSFRLVGQHLSNSQSKYQEAEKRFGKIQSRFEQIDGTIKELDGETKPSLPESP
jgi:DNA recombination protein RmuC